MGKVKNGIKLLYSIEDVRGYTGMSPERQAKARKALGIRMDAREFYLPGEYRSMIRYWKAENGIGEGHDE